MSNKHAEAGGSDIEQELALMRPLDESVSEAPEMVAESQVG